MSPAVPPAVSALARFVRRRPLKGATAFVPGKMEKASGESGVVVRR